MNYLVLLGKAYKAYQYAWCKQRGYNPEDIDPETGLKGECYIGIREFEDNEFQDEEYMSELLDRVTFVYWENRKKLKVLWVEQKICEASILQRVKGCYICPRCGGEMENELTHNSFSRRTDIYICSACGMLEAIEDARKAGDPSFMNLPTDRWALIQNELDNIANIDYDIQDMFKFIDAMLAYRAYEKNCLDEG